MGVCKKIWAEISEDSFKKIIDKLEPSKDAPIGFYDNPTISSENLKKLEEKHWAVDVLELKSPDTQNLSNQSVDKQKRYRQILSVLKGNMTAKEIAVEMYYRGMIPTSERNFVSPRLTELEYKGIVYKSGRKKCKWTGKIVSTYALNGTKTALKGKIKKEKILDFLVV